MLLGLTRNRPSPVLIVLTALVVILAACGGSAEETISSGQTGDSTSSTAVSAEDLAKANTPDLQTSDDPLDVEVLAVADGSISSLRAAVTGDRPVLLWFFAPH